MAEGLNKVILLGNVGAEPRLRDTKTGPALFLRLATTKRSFDRETERVRETTEWHDCAIWGKRAEKLSEHITKGTGLCIEGELRHRQRDVGGEKVTVSTVAIQQLFFTGNKAGGRSRGQGDGEDW
jgi:single-strand DNA-binding protein